MMNRLMGYVQATLHMRMIGWIGDSREQLFPHFFAYADFAGDIETQRSTSAFLLGDTRAKLIFAHLSWEHTTNLRIAFDP